MRAELIFSIANVIAVLCWVLLALLPTRRWVTEVVTSRAAPAVFALAYIAIVIVVFPRAEGSFSTLAGVVTRRQRAPDCFPVSRSTLGRSGSENVNVVPRATVLVTFAFPAC